MECKRVVPSKVLLKFYSSSTKFSKDTEKLKETAQKAVLELPVRRPVSGLRELQAPSKEREGIFFRIDA